MKITVLFRYCCNGLLVLPCLLQAQGLLFVQDSTGLFLTDYSSLYVEGGLVLGGGMQDGRLSGEGTLILGANQSPGWGHGDWENENQADPGWVSGSGKLVLASGKQRIGGSQSSSIPSLVLGGTVGDSFRLEETLTVGDSLVHRRGGILSLGGHVLELQATSPDAWSFRNGLYEGGVVAETHPLDGGSAYGTVAWRTMPDQTYTLPFRVDDGAVPVHFRLPPGTSAMVRWSTYGTGSDNHPLPVPDGTASIPLGYWPDSVRDLYSAFAGGDHAEAMVDRYWLVDPGAASGMQASVSWTASEASGLLAGRESELVAQAYVDSAWDVPGSGTSMFPLERSVQYWVNGPGIYALTPAALPLPVGCLAFEAALEQGARVVLSWQLGAGAADRELLLERRSGRASGADGPHAWTSVAMAPSESDQETLSGFWSDQPGPGSWLYRLSVRSASGDTAMRCPLRAVEVPEIGNPKSVTLSPNPFTNGLQVANIGCTDGDQWGVFDPYGRLVLRQACTDGLESVELDIPPGPPGLYVLVLERNGRRILRASALRVHR
jgi:hypothetical protein